MKTHDVNSNDSPIQRQQGDGVDGAEGANLESTTEHPVKISERKIMANRKNSEKSTGPKTPIGKKTVSKNAIKHGILSREMVVLDEDGKEDPAEFHELFVSIREDCQPQGFREEMWVEKIAVSYWRNRRVLRYESGQIAMTLASQRDNRENPDPLLQELFGNSKPRHSEINSSVHVDYLALPSRTDTDKIVRYETMISKELNHAVSELDRLQQRRRVGAVPPPSAKSE